MNGKVIAGIILIVLQLMGIAGNFIDGGIVHIFDSVVYTIGFFALGIIGVILLVVGLNQNNNKGEK